MLSDNRLQRRAAAYFLSARAVHAVKTFGEIRSIDIENPDEVLTEQKAVASATLAQFLADDNGRRIAEPILTSILCGLQAVQTAGASILELDGMGHALRQPATFRPLGKARQFVSSHWNLIVRLANAALELRTVSSGQIAFLVDSQPSFRRAA
jgi:hypothetical protein